MKLRNLLLPFILTIATMSACSDGKELVIELANTTPVAHVGKKYDFTNVLYVEDGVKYQLDVYYQDYNTFEEKTLPVTDTFFFTPTEAFDITVVVNAKKGSQKAQRTRIVPVVIDPEVASLNNLEMCHYESGEYRGLGSLATISYKETRGPNSTSSRKITFANSRDLPDNEEVDNPNTVRASFNLAVTPTIGEDVGDTIDSKENILSFDIKLSKEFFESHHNLKHQYCLTIEDKTWANCKADLDIVDNPYDFDFKKTDDGWLHVETNLSEVSEFDSLGEGTYVLTFGFYGITNETREKASIVFDNIALKEIPDDQKHERETASLNNIEMCRFENGAYRGTGSKAEISYTELQGPTSITSRKITFKNSQDLPDVMDVSNNATVNASFNMVNTSSIGIEACNQIDAKQHTLEFDIKLSQEFFDSGFPYRHMFSLKIEDGEWAPVVSWIPFIPTVGDPSEFTYAKTNNGWLHVSYRIADNIQLMALGNGTYVITFGFFGITNTTRQTASVIFDNIKLVPNP